MIYYKRRNNSVTELPWPDGDGTRITYSTVSRNYKSWNISGNYVQRDRGDVMNSEYIERERLL